MAYFFKRLSILSLICLVVACLALSDNRIASASVGNSGSAPRVVHSGKQLKLRVGQRTVLKGESLRIKFVAVSNDSRCPKNVTCVWAGNAEVLLEVGPRSGRGKSLKVNTNASRQLSDEGKYGRYTVKLLELSPHPLDGRKIAARDYTATLLISRE